MSTAYETSTKKERNVLYVVVAVVLIALMVAAPLLYTSAKKDQAAKDKADQLISKLHQAGAYAPSQDQIVNALGNDGGAVCANPNQELTRAILLSQLSNGAAGPGMRPVIADSKVVQGELLIVSVYCPDELPALQKYVDGLSLNNDVAGE